MTAVADVSIRRSQVPRALLRRGSLRGLLRMALEEWTLIGLCWLGLLVLPDGARLWLYPVVCLVLAGRFHALGVLLHDASHMPLRRKSVLTYLIEALCGYPVSSTIDAMRYHHLRHHRDSGM